ncbi:hypothetical protein ACHAWF_009036 [Thalassiosira exigua]
MARPRKDRPPPRRTDDDGDDDDVGARRKRAAAGPPRLVDDGARLDESDDESIDEECAFDSDDERRYGDMFPGGKGKSKKRGKASSRKARGGDGDGDDSDDSDDADGDDDDDGSGSEGSESGEEDWAGSSSSDDEEDDGGQYMLDLLANLDGQAKPDGAGAAKGEGKKGKSEGGLEGGKIPLSGPASEAAARLTEGEFRSGSLAGMNSSKGGDGGGGGKLTLDALMGDLGDATGYSAARRSLRALAGGLAEDKSADDIDDEADGRGTGGTKKLVTTPAPVAKVVSDRASRMVHYQSTTEDVSRWQDAVHEQRDAETLDFRTNRGGAATHGITRDALVDKFEASNDFEREMRGALERAGMEDEREIARREKRTMVGDDDADGDGDGGEGGGDAGEGEGEDDLGSNRITLAEYKRRHAQLAKLRSLMFQEEQRNHRINKIKSKKYRKIRKRQRDRLKDAEDDAARIEDPDGVAERERIEREEMERMEERMTLAHKNTSKWARRMLRRGKHMGVDERKALSLQIARGEELRRKASGEAGPDEGEGSDGETEGDLLAKARDVLLEGGDEDDAEEGGGTKDAKKKGLFQLEFMKRGMESQRRRAREEARRLLEELEGNEASNASGADDYDDLEEREGREEEVKHKERTATEEETKAVLAEGKMVASSLQFGKGGGFAVRVGGTVDLSGEGAGRSGADAESGKEDAVVGGDEAKRKAKKRKRKKKGKEESVADADPVSPAAAEREEEENPWLASGGGGSGKGEGRVSKAIAAKSTVDVAAAASALVDADPPRRSASQAADEGEADKGEDGGEAAPSSSSPGVADLSQAELVRKAFASPSDVVAAEEEFRKEKERMSERDDPTRKKKEDKFVSGWGSWAGAGAPPPKKPRKLPPKLRAPAKKAPESDAPKRKDHGKSTVIINEKRIKKTSAYQLSEIPYPYRSREEYERAISGSIGREWNTLQGSKDMSRPAVLVRAGKIIQPIAKKSKSKKRATRAPAKF